MILSESLQLFAARTSRFGIMLYCLWLKRTVSEIAASAATVMTAAEALQRQLFGMGKRHKRFKPRVGNLLILPKHDQLIWFEHLKGKKFSLRGMHGGLSTRLSHRRAVGRR
jgi:hypothetical protein